MATRKINLAAIEGSIKSPKTPASLKMGLIKKYGKQLGFTQADVNKYMKTSGTGKRKMKKNTMPQKGARVTDKSQLKKGEVVFLGDRLVKVLHTSDEITRGIAILAGITPEGKVHPYSFSLYNLTDRPVWKVKGKSQNPKGYFSGKTYAIKKGNKYLNIKKFDKHGEPIWTELGRSWITSSLPQAEAQATLLDAKVVQIVDSSPRKNPLPKWSGKGPWKMTQEDWKSIHRDYKGSPGEPKRAMTLDPITGGTTSVPVEIVSSKPVKQIKMKEIKIEVSKPAYRGDKHKVVRAFWNGQEVASSGAWAKKYKGKTYYESDQSAQEWDSLADMKRYVQEKGLTQAYHLAGLMPINPASRKSKKKFKPGDKVSYAGYPGTVMRHYSGNMYEVRLASGDVTVDASELVRITEREWLDTPRGEKVKGKGSDLYIVTGKVHAKGMRDTISKPMSKARAEAFKKSLEADLKTAAPQYKWVSELKVQRVNPAKYSTGKYKRTRLVSPKKFDPRSFRTVKAGKGTKLVIGCPEGEYMPRKGKCKVGTRAQAKLTRKNPKTPSAIKSEIRKRIIQLEGITKEIENQKHELNSKQLKDSLETIHGNLMYINGIRFTLTDEDWTTQEKRAYGRDIIKLQQKYYDLHVFYSIGKNPAGKKYKFEIEREKAIAHIKASPLHKKALALLTKKWQEFSTLKPKVTWYHHPWGIFSDLQQAGLVDMQIYPSRVSGDKAWGSKFRFKLGTGEITSKGMSKNPPASGGTEIYSNITAIEATKGNNSLWPKEPFRHDFKMGGKILGLPNGDLLIKKGKDGKKLWKFFDYGPNDGTRKNPASYAPMVQVFMERTDIKPHVIFRSRIQDLKRAASELGFSVTRKVYKDGHEYYIVKSQHPTVAKSLEAKIKLKRFLKDAKINDHSGYYSNKPAKHSGASKHYIGIKRNKPIKIHSLKNPPTKAQYPQYTQMVGPFSSKKAAQEYAAKN